MLEIVQSREADVEKTEQWMRGSKKGRKDWNVLVKSGRRAEEGRVGLVVLVDMRL